MVSVFKYTADSPEQSEWWEDNLRLMIAMRSIWLMNMYISVCYNKAYQSVVDVGCEPLEHRLPPPLISKYTAKKNIKTP